jgi:hypothetical protein
MLGPGGYERLHPEEMLEPGGVLEAGEWLTRYGSGTNPFTRALQALAAQKRAKKPAVLRASAPRDAEGKPQPRFGSFGVNGGSERARMNA